MARTLVLERTTDVWSHRVMIAGWHPQLRDANEPTSQGEAQGLP